MDKPTIRSLQITIAGNGYIINELGLYGTKPDRDLPYVASSIPKLNSVLKLKLAEVKQLFDKESTEYKEYLAKDKEKLEKYQQAHLEAAKKGK